MTVLMRRVNNFKTVQLQFGEVNVLNFAKLGTFCKQITVIFQSESKWGKSFELLIASCMKWKSDRNNA